MTKLRLELAPVEFDDVVLVLQQSAESGKYEENGWLEGKSFEKEKNIASIRRHINDFRRGNLVDSDSGLHPLLHAACRCLMQYTLDIRNSRIGNSESDSEVLDRSISEIATFSPQEAG